MTIICFADSQATWCSIHPQRNDKESAFCIQLTGPGGTLQGRKERPTALGPRRTAVSLLLC